MNDQHEQSKPPVMASREVIRAFVGEVLETFDAQKPFPLPVKFPDRIIYWQFNVNDFFFIESGRETGLGKATSYIALMRREPDADIEELRADSSRDQKTWNFPTSSVNLKGQRLVQAVERTDSAAISLMIGYLMMNLYIIPDAGECEALRELARIKQQIAAEEEDGVGDLLFSGTNHENKSAK